MNNFNQQQVPPSSPQTPPTPSVPPAHQMMGSMPKTTAVASGGGMMANIVAVLILIVGAGSLYFAFNKNNSPESESSSNQVSGFAFNNDDNADQANITFEDTDNTTTTNTQNEEATQPVTNTTPSTSRGMFKCEDLFPATDMQEFTKDSKPVKVTTEESIDRISCEYEQIENDDWQTLTHSYNVSIDFPYLNVTTSMLFEATKKSTTSLESLPNIGTEAFTGLLGGILRPVVVLSTNQKYVFWVSSTWDMGPQKTDKTYLKDIAKIVDANLSKF